MKRQTWALAAAAALALLVMAFLERRQMRATPVSEPRPHDTRPDPKAGPDPNAPPDPNSKPDPKAGPDTQR